MAEFATGPVSSSTEEKPSYTADDDPTDNPMSQTDNEVI